MLKLAVARVHIEIETADNLVAIEHLIGFHVFLPGVGIPGFYAYLKQVLHQRKNTVASRVVIEIFAHDLGIDVVLFALNFFHYKAALPWFQPLRIRHILLQPG